ncbi:Gfo/Idh/MocA family oxidoreductase [Salinibacterium sp. SYSU T00001]|uniref:Gfo/Idh/MocA family protein n=1 Tax=Homoserinimonas sedimenticola TaxID=2986805 RepID=UPI0022365EA7|nr:Gfo/Idh/MocA family oxidoreductase [Salinibacterium sedimenticola]MCW4385154.1 Gfo/Idh/MocA family oxidoreductase [Salinibacterium sedimenticola]
MALRWGILGPGGIARAQTRDLLANGFTVTAVGSRRQESARAFAEEFGIPTAHGSYEALVADPDVDVIYVATPHPFHVSGALLALDAGKHVLLEKPFTVTAADARAVVDRARERGLVVLEAMWTRFLPHMVRIREIIASGELGEVVTLLADHTQLLPSDPSHRLQDPALGGGALLDLGIYPVSFAHDLFGAPSGIHASATFTATGVDRQTAIILEFGGDRRAVLQTALDTLGPNRASVIGTLGRIEIESVWYTPSAFTRYDSTGAIVERHEAGQGDTSAEGSRGMQWQAWEMERLVSEGRSESEIISPEESVNIMQTLDAIRERIGLVYPMDARD